LALVRPKGDGSSFAVAAPRDAAGGEALPASPLPDAFGNDGPDHEDGHDDGPADAG